MIYQNLAHQARGDSKEMGSILAVWSLLLIDETQIRLMNNRCGL
jgi:hypothetical protein